VKLGRHPLATGAAPTWAVAWGADALGVFASFAVGEVEQRMRWVPPGHFVMGSPKEEDGRWDDEGPMHRVTLTKGYWLGETSVTQALWTAVIGDNPSHFKGPMRPVENVSWKDCAHFLDALDAGVVGAGLRLPTEAEWEYACRSGTVGAAGRGASDAATLDRIAWYEPNSGGQTHDVGSKEPNPIGLHDMLGNVWEWCSDWMGPYASDAMVNPSGAADGSYRVLRGGAWDDRARYVRAACRIAFDPGIRDARLGFRLARGP